MADQRFRSQQRDPGLSQASTPGAKGRFSQRGEDPLAELARLIGQDDPFADFRDDQRRAPQPAGNGHAARNGNGNSRRSEQDQDYDERDAYAREPRAPSRPQRYAEDDPRYADGNAARKNGRGAYAYGGGRDEVPSRRAPEPDIGRGPHDDRALPPQTAKRSPRQADYVQEPEAEYEDPRYARGGNGYADPRQAYDSPYDREDDAAEYEPEYEEDRYAGEYDEQAYVDPAPGARRWLYVGIVAAVGLLVVGGAGVYGYKMLVGKYSGGTAPTIRPADTPSKVAPQTAQTGDGQKLIYDRLDGQKPGERIVSREEQPADVAQNTGRVVTGPQSAGPVTAFAPVPGTMQNAPAAITGSAPVGTLPAGEPRKVRTTTVRADGTIVDVPRPAQPAAAPRSAPAQQQPLALSPYSQQQPAQTDDQDAQQPVGAPSRTAALAQPPSRTAQPANQQPWGAIQQPAAAPAPVQQQVSNYVPAGSYVVQVASQKSEADARTSWQQLQAKYSNVFGNYQANIKRVDLGDRGTFYRAMLGPFANRDQAYEMCQNLKSAGGECIVQRN
jgi:hypothetical protein